MDQKLTTSHAYPQPLFERAVWSSLDGAWDFAIDASAEWQLPEEVHWNQTIQVPFAPETPASGIQNTGFFHACWYRRRFKAPPLKPAQRLQLHFGAVDYAATVWVNNRRLIHHRGGYTPFCVDITDALTGDDFQTIVVRAEDDPHDLSKPRGKQDWQLEPHSIWYYRTTGIWQTVWLVVTHETHISELRWVSSVERWEIELSVHVTGKLRDHLRLRVQLLVENAILADDTYSVIASEVHRRIALSDPGIDDYRNELLWSPSRPTLIRAQLQLLGADGELLDAVQSYTALRSIGVQGDRIVLNGRPYPLRLVLDQGYWPETGLTPPSDEALRYDIELTKAMGFNGVRKHQKIESPRYLYWAAVLGLLVWEEMPSAYRFTQSSIERLTSEWVDVVRRDSSHPCIIAWVPFNESWGVPELPNSPAQRHYVQALYHLTKTLDPARPVVGNDGWESVATDIIGIHDYDDNAERLAARYATEDVAAQVLKERPAGRILQLSPGPHTDQPIMLTEFGGIAFSPDQDRTWGYSRVDTPESFAAKYTKLLTVVNSLTLFAGFCYTQFADTYQEANGLLYADRTPKIPLETIRAATRGTTLRADALESLWREQLMHQQREHFRAQPEEYHRPETP